MEYFKKKIKTTASANKKRNIYILCVIICVSTVISSWMLIKTIYGQPDQIDYSSVILSQSHNNTYRNKSLAHKTTDDSVILARSHSNTNQTIIDNQNQQKSAKKNSFVSADDYTKTTSIYNLLKNQSHLSNPAILSSIKSYQYAKQRGLIKNKDIFTIVDYSMPSYAPRMYIFNLKTHQLLDNILVAQGRNSGRGAYAYRFSNVYGSNESSLGTYITAEQPFEGDHGSSLRINGIEKGINNNAISRGIIIHNAWYVSKAFAKANHRVGNSLGCFAVSKNNIKKVIQLLKGGSVLFAYATPELHDTLINTSL